MFCTLSTMGVVPERLEHPPGGHRRHRRRLRGLISSPPRALFKEDIDCELYKGRSRFPLRGGWYAYEAYPRDEYLLSSRQADEDTQAGSSKNLRKTSLRSLISPKSPLRIYTAPAGLANQPTNHLSSASSALLTNIRWTFLTKKVDASLY